MYWNDELHDRQSVRELSVVEPRVRAHQKCSNVRVSLCSSLLQLLLINIERPDAVLVSAQTDN